MDMIKVVLKKTGTCWINLGDTYSGGVAHSDWENTDSDWQREGQKFKSIKKNQISAKSQFGIPQRFYADCIDNGWIARNFIPWVKENSMPSSVKDRFTNKWEPVMFFVKEQKYYFNLDGVRVKPKGETKPFNVRVRDAKKGLGTAKMGDLSQAWKMSKQEDLDYNEKGERKYSEQLQSNTNRLGQYRDEQRKQDATLGADGKPLANYKGFNDRWSTRAGFDKNGNCFGCGEHFTKHHSAHDKNLGRGDTAEYTPCNPKGKNPGDIIDESKWQKHYDSNGNCLGCGRHFSQHTVTNRAQGSENRDERQKHDYVWCNPLGKNPGDVLKINPRPFPEAHFATFPVDLPLFILKCACPKQVCKNCRIPREPIVKSNNPSKEYADYENDRNFANTNQITTNPQSSKSLHRQSEGVYSTAKIIGWTKCNCNADFQPGMILDPFFGSGTVGLAAEMLGLNWKGIELSEEYVNIAKKRLEPHNFSRLDDFSKNY